MKTRLLRKLEVSEIGMGCMGFSHAYGKVPVEDYAVTAFSKAYDCGCTFFDTAEGYGSEMFYPGHNEQLLGKASEPFRKEVVLATKLHISPDEYIDNSLYDVLCKHIERSLKNLRTDYMDLYYLHRVNEDIPVEDIAESMGRLIKKRSDPFLGYVTIRTNL